MGTLNLDIYFKTTWEYQSVRLQKYNEDDFSEILSNFSKTNCLQTCSNFSLDQIIAPEIVDN